MNKVGRLFFAFLITTISTSPAISFRASLGYWKANTTALYAFTTHTFSNCSTTGYNGPSLASCQTAYSAASWSANPSYFSVTSGYQVWTVPKNGTYRISAYGAEGGYVCRGGGKGAYVRGDFSLTKGDKLIMVVGQQGNSKGCSDWGGGGGGGTFVAKQVVSSSHYVTIVGQYVDPVLVAAGGGGDYDDGIAYPGQQGSSSVSASTAAGTTNHSVLTGGAGFVGNSVGSSSYTAYSFINGAVGCNVGGSYPGGFGGGGCPYNGGGGGGGYQGGDSTDGGYAYGGYSYNAGSNTTGSSGTQSGHGSIVILAL